MSFMSRFGVQRVVGASVREEETQMIEPALPEDPVGTVCSFGVKQENDLFLVVRG
jgi:hypothetical protein